MTTERREIEEYEFHERSGSITGEIVFDVSVEVEGRQTLVSYCEMEGVRIEGVIIPTDTITAIFGKAAVAQAREYAIEHFQQEIDAGDWAEAA